jgi:hypothetical protein
MLSKVISGDRTGALIVALRAARVAGIVIETRVTAFGFNDMTILATVARPGTTQIAGMSPV